MTPKPGERFKGAGHENSKKNH